MKKRIISITLFLLMIFVIAGCGSSKKDDVNISKSQPGICIYSVNESYKDGQDMMNKALKDNKQKDVININQNKPEYWSKNIGNVHLVKIDSNLYINKNYSVQAENQLNWLKEDLKKNRNIKCKVLIMQHPFLTTCLYKRKQSRGIYASIEPYIRAYKIDAIVSGNLHAYERIYKNNLLCINLDNGNGNFDIDKSYKHGLWINDKLVTGKLEYVKVIYKNGKLNFQTIAVGEKEDGKLKSANKVIDTYKINKD